MVGDDEHASLTRAGGRGDVLGAEDAEAVEKGGKQIDSGAACSVEELRGEREAGLFPEQWQGWGGRRTGGRQPWLGFDSPPAMAPRMAVSAWRFRRR